jgi:signal peptidase
MKNVFKYVKIVINVIVVIFVLLFVLVVCLQRFSNNELSFLNYRMFTVVSGSMEPKYSIGDVLIAKETDAEDIKVGDAVSYLGASDQFKNKVITHEVIEIEKDSNGKYLFHTKGIANVAEDPVITEDQVYGVIVHEAKLLSMIYVIVGKPIGMFIFVIVPVFYVIGSEFLSFLLEKEEERREQMKKSKKKIDKEKE